ncbi:IS110 family transposase [Billgrantia endophytica]|uniref:IS110 family transposase n=2 Tax=Billgrantia endophytica TaxID=2033802 RepID=A0A2N7U4E1_9GAMM|nr:IS110 family transposase [Halomonas endophytica]PMR75292.1 IS110 family transposase [Halomonas endophytica]
MVALTQTTELVVGVDPHKHTHTAAIIVASTGGLLTDLTVSADPDGFESLMTTVQRYSGTRCWVIEGCGQWGRGLAAWLMARDETVREIDSPRRAARRMGKKDDTIDALRAAREAIGRNNLAEPRGLGDRQALAMLMSARRSAVQMTGDTERQLHAAAATCPEPLARRLRGLKTHRLVTLCAQWRPTGDNVTQSIAQTMRRMARRILELRAEAFAYKQRIEAWVRVCRPDLLDLVGVGPITAAQLLMTWSHRGRFRNEAAFAMLAGVAPLPASSGLITRHRLNRRGDRQLNAALHVVAIQRQRHDARTQAYFEKRRAEGKSDREIRRCLKRYIARDLFRVLEKTA